MEYNAFQMHKSLKGDKKKDGSTKPKHKKPTENKKPESKNNGKIRDLTTDDLVAAENANKLVRAHKRLRKYNEKTIRKNERQENKFRQRERKELAGNRPVKFTTAQQQDIDREALRHTTPTYTRR